MHYAWNILFQRLFTEILCVVWGSQHLPFLPRLGAFVLHCALSLLSCGRSQRLVLTMSVGSIWALGLREHWYPGEVSSCIKHQINSLWCSGGLRIWIGFLQLFIWRQRLRFIIVLSKDANVPSVDDCCGGRSAREAQLFRPYLNSKYVIELVFNNPINISHMKVPANFINVELSWPQSFQS